MRYILCFLLPDELSQEINLVSESFEKGVSARIAPHISLTYPFWYEDSVGEIEKKIQSLVLVINTFKASLSEVETFNKEDGGRVIYLSLDPEEGFRNLHKKLIKILSVVTFDTRFFPERKLPEEYKPHITVAMNGKASDLDFVREKLAKIKGKEFWVDKITLLSNEKPKEGWKTVRKFKLKNVIL